MAADSRNKGGGIGNESGEMEDWGASAAGYDGAQSMNDGEVIENRDEKEKTNGGGDLEWKTVERNNKGNESPGRNNGERYRGKNNENRGHRGGGYNRGHDNRGGGYYRGYDNRGGGYRGSYNGGGYRGGAQNTGNGGKKEVGGNNTRQDENQAERKTYADTTRVMMQQNQRLDRKVLEITLMRIDGGNRAEVDDDAMANLLTKELGLDLQKDTTGIQENKMGKYLEVNVWCKNHVDIDELCRGEGIEVCPGIITKTIRVPGNPEVTVTISGLDFNTPDEMVIEYMEKFGAVMITKKCIYPTHQSGYKKGNRTGDRKFQADFSKAKEAMGQIHFLGGKKIRVSYRGNERSCARCYGGRNNCPGGGNASLCEENYGEKVDLMQHMRSLWTRIGYKPTTFVLPEKDDDEDEERTKRILDKEYFEPAKKSKPMITPKRKEFTKVLIDNFPSKVTKEEILEILRMRVNDEFSEDDIEITNVRNNSASALIGPGPSVEVVHKIVEKVDYNIIREEAFPNRRLFARKLKPAPKRKGHDEESTEDEENDDDSGESIDDERPVLPPPPPLTEKSSTDKDLTQGAGSKSESETTEERKQRKKEDEERERNEKEAKRMEEERKERERVEKENEMKKDEELRLKLEEENRKREQIEKERERIEQEKLERISDKTDGTNRNETLKEKDKTNPELSKKRGPKKMESRETDHGIFYGPVGGTNFYSAKQLRSAEKKETKDDDHDALFKGNFYNMKKLVKLNQHREEATKKKGNMNHLRKSQAASGSLEKARAYSK